MNKYDEIISCLQGKQPSMGNEEDMTEMIMDSLPDFGASDNGDPTVKALCCVVPMESRKRRTFVTLLRVTLSATAIFLIGLFLWTNAVTDIPNEEKTYITAQRLEARRYLQNVDENSTPMELYAYYLKSCKAREKSISKLSKMIKERYENN